MNHDRSDLQGFGQDRTGAANMNDSRLTDAELDALLAWHVIPEKHKKASSEHWRHICNCGGDWPCEKSRLATEVRELRAVRDAAKPIIAAVFSPDALLEPLGVLRERGLGWRIDSLAEQGTTVTGGYQAEIGRWAKGNKTPWKVVATSEIVDTPSEALALAVADAMEANR